MEQLEFVQPFALSPYSQSAGQRQGEGEHTKRKNSKPVSTQSVGDKVKVETCQYSQYRRQNTGPNVSVHIV